MTLYTKKPIDTKPLQWDGDDIIDQARTDHGSYSIYQNLTRYKRFTVVYEGENISQDVITTDDRLEAYRAAQTHYDNLRSVMLPIDRPTPRFSPKHDHFDEGWNACLNAMQHSIDDVIRKHEQQLEKEPKNG